MSKKSMREEMPLTAAFIDGLRAAFGKEMIDGQIRKGMNGQATFHASENGIEIGTKSVHGRCVRFVNGVAVDVVDESKGSGE